MRILLVLAMAMTSCNTSAAMPLPHISISSEGGIAGRGIGGITIDDPKVSARDMRHACPGVLTDDERAELRSVSIKADDAPPPGRPDQLRYTMTIGDVSASWYGEEPPAELAHAFKTVWAIRARVLGSCHDQ